MKLALSSALLLSMALTSLDVTMGQTVTRISGPVAKRILSQSRKLEEDEEEEEEEDENAFILDYQLNFVKCAAGEKFLNEEGEYESSSVIFRLCPSNSSCGADETNAFGCDEGYGDFITGINTFVDAYAETLNEDRRRRLEEDEEEEFRLEEYAQCEEADFPDEEEEEDEDDRRKMKVKRTNRKLEEEEEVQFFIGPACTDDGLDIKLELFSDEDCLYVEEDVTYEDMSGGNSLEYSSGGIGSAVKCISCVEQNDDGDYEASEFCKELYEDSGKCEAFMESYNYNNGKSEAMCETINELTADLITKSGGGAGVFWFLVIVAVGGAGYVFMQKKKGEAAKTESSYGQMA